MTDVTLTQVALFLAAAVVAAPLAKVLRIGNVLGYLLVGVLIGPFGLGFVVTVYEVNTVLHFAEFGVVLLLFLIGLELRPKRLWAMRAAIFGLGGAQVALTGAVLAIMAMAFGLAWQAAALRRSGAVAVLDRLRAADFGGERRTGSAATVGLAFAVLLFQDLAAIPLIALPPLFAVTAKDAAPAHGTPVGGQRPRRHRGVVVIGRYLLDGIFSLVALTARQGGDDRRALLTVVGVTLVMEQAGLSASLGAFIAGALLAELHYRHEIEADIAALRGPPARPIFHGGRHVAQPRADRPEPVAGRRRGRGPPRQSRASSSTGSAGVPGLRPVPPAASRW